MQLGEWTAGFLTAEGALPFRKAFPFVVIMRGIGEQRSEKAATRRDGFREARCCVSRSRQVAGCAVVVVQKLQAALGVRRAEVTEDKRLSANAEFFPEPLLEAIRFRRRSWFLVLVALKIPQPSAFPARESVLWLDGAKIARPLRVRNTIEDIADGGVLAAGLLAAF